MKPTTSVDDVSFHDVPQYAAELALPASAADEPSRFADYYELTKPRLNMLVVVTTCVGYYIAARTANVSLFHWTIIHTLIGTTLTAASAAVLNQVVEKPFDQMMRRTRNRPIASGRLSSAEGTIFGAALGILGIGYLALAANPLTALLGAITWVTYMLIYTPMKRKSPYCTLVGAITGALPPAMGVTAVTNSITPLAAGLFAILFVWQMPHFFGLALMYKDDYGTGGFKMLPNCENGDRRTRVQIIAWTAALIPISLIPTFVHISNAGALYFVGATMMGLWFLNAAIKCANRLPGSDRKLFLTSIMYLPALLAVLMIDQ
jgi:protoheme IX farnesyltransferase